MESTSRTLLWRQLGAAIDTLGNAIAACPETLWCDRARRPEFWYAAYHTLFFLDYYMSESIADFAPPPPFNLDELDPAGLMPERPFTKAELRAYLEHGRGKCRAAVASLDGERARVRLRFPWGEIEREELMLYTLRHVQHHAAQLNLILRQTIDASSGWVVRAPDELGPAFPGPPRS